MKVNEDGKGILSQSEVYYYGNQTTRLSLKDVLLFCQKRIFGEEVEMKVRPGDNITLYCDRSVTLGSKIVWIRNCSHENQPSLIIDYKKLYLEIFQRFSFIHNPYSKSYDLHITNISVSDLGLYYCAKLENNIRKDAKGIIFSSEVYYYGNQTRLSLKDAVTDQKDKLKGRNRAECMDEEVCYASLDVTIKRQKQCKKKRVQSSDFSTYAQVRTQTE
ncbi:hypothetical protein cypCar_00027365 [Cyprinus carpio]|nr:hypothetical protein cypCar_00027365 [Cyprinus carpio]